MWGIQRLWVLAIFPDDLPFCRRNPMPADILGKEIGMIEL